MIVYYNMIAYYKIYIFTRKDDRSTLAEHVYTTITRIYIGHYYQLIEKAGLL